MSANQFEADVWRLWSERKMNTTEITGALKATYPVIHESDVHRAVTRINAERFAQQRAEQDQKARGVI